MLLPHHQCISQLLLTSPFFALLPNLLSLIQPFIISIIHAGYAFTRIVTSHALAQLYKFAAPGTPLGGNAFTMDNYRGERRLKGLHDRIFVSPPPRENASPEAEEYVDSGFEEPADEGELAEAPEENAEGEWEGFVDKDAQEEGHMPKESFPKKPVEGEEWGEGAFLQPGDWERPLERRAPAPPAAREEQEKREQLRQSQGPGQRPDPGHGQEPGQNKDPGEGSESASSHASVPELDWDVMGCSHGMAEGQVYSYNIHLLNTKCAGHHMFLGGLYSTATEANRAMENDVLARFGGNGNQELLGWQYHKGECLRVLARTQFGKHVSAAVWRCEKSPEPEFRNEYEDGGEDEHEMENEGEDCAGDAASKERNQEERGNQKDEAANGGEEKNQGKEKEANNGKAEEKQGEEKGEENSRQYLF